MKKGLYLIAAITFAATSAMASKARQKALSNTTAITDVQSIFLNPADVHYVGDFATFEMGDSTIGGATPDAEGGFLHTMGDAKFGFYLGKTSASVAPIRAMASVASGVTLLSHENPFEIFYGAKAADLNWAASFSYSNSDKKNTAASNTDDQKQSAMGLRLGVKTDVWGAYANVGLGSTAKTGDTEYKGKSGLTIGGHYLMDTIKIIVKQDMAGAKATDATGDVFDYETSETTIGFTNAWKSEGSMAFYGLAYIMRTDKFKEVGAMAAIPPANTIPVSDGTKIESTKLPFTLGAEVLATSWLKLRGSVSQNVLLGSQKNSPLTDAGTIDHDTTTAAGAGFVWGKNTLDVVMDMGTSGNLNAATFGTSASYTYLF